MKKVLRFTPELILCGYILLFLFFKHPGETWDRSINSDGKGYYAYLPAIFIYHDLTYKFVESYEGKYYPADRAAFKEFRNYTNDGKTVNKYFPGLAIIWLPFFLLAHLLSYFLDYPMDGYSLIYQYSISIAALFYLWLGCRFLMMMLQKAGGSIKIAAVVTFVIAAGTNIMYFAIVEDSMSHVYSFALVSLFLYYVYRYFQDFKGKYFIFAATLFGLILLVRPTNGLIILLIPLLAWLADRGSRIEDRESRIENQESSIEHRESRAGGGVKKYTVGILILIVLLSTPLLLWHQTTGHWIVYTYTWERFHFLHPHFFGILFSYNRGWFLYTPVALISVFGFYPLWKKNKTAFYWTITFFLLFIYISSCWWMWYYASKFGQRIFVDLYAFTGILLFLIYKYSLISKAAKYLVTTTLLFFIGLNIFQCYQHSIFVFPATDLTSEIYWDSFTRLHPAAKVYLPSEAIISEKSFFTDMEKPEGWQNPWTLRGPFGTSGKRCSLITRKNPYSVGRYETLAPLFTTQNRIIRVSAMVFSSDSISRSSLVVEVNSGDQKLSYSSVFLTKFVQADQWTPFEAAFYVPRDIPDNSVAKIYFFNNKGSVPLFIDDLKIDFLSLKDVQEYTLMEGIQIPVR